MRDQTYPKDRFEVILVDRRYELRHNEVMALAKQYNVPLIHVPEHRRNGRWGVTASAYTTSFALARGRVIIMLVDWTYAPPGWIEAHLQHHNGPPTYAVAPYLYHSVGITESIYRRLAKETATEVCLPWEAYVNQPKLKLKRPFDFSDQDMRADGESAKYVEADAVLRGEILDEVSAFEDGLFDPQWLHNMPPMPACDPGGRGHLKRGVEHLDCYVTHLKNESILREAVYHLNGVDIWGERGGRVSIDSEFGLRAEAAGLRFYWEPQAMAHCVNPRHAVCRTMPFGVDRERVERRWSREDCTDYYERRRAEIRSRKFLVAPAPYTLEGLARKLEPWRSGAPIDVSKLDVPDLEFFGADIWPDSPYLPPAALAR